MTTLNTLNTVIRLHGATQMWLLSVKLSMGTVLLSGFMCRVGLLCPAFRITDNLKEGNFKLVSLSLSLCMCVCAMDQILNPTHSLTHSLTCSLIHFLSHSCNHLMAFSWCSAYITVLQVSGLLVWIRLVPVFEEQFTFGISSRLVTHLLTRSFTHSTMHSFNCSVAQSFTHW